MPTLAVIDKFILATFTMVLLLAHPTYQSIVEASHDPVQITKKNSSGVQASRSVASVSGKSIQKAATSTFESQLDIHCKKQADEAALTTHHEFIQLTGKNCFNASDKQILNIENRTNGYSATVFQQKNYRYKTDLIQLSPGTNHLVITYQAETGESVQQKLLVHAL